MVHMSGRKLFVCPDDEQFTFELDLNFVHSTHDLTDGLEMDRPVLLIERLQYSVDGFRACFNAVNQDVFIFNKGFIVIMWVRHRLSPPLRPAAVIPKAFSMT